MPSASSASEAEIAVSGVRSSCDTVDTNSSFMRSTSLRAEMSCTNAEKNRPSPVPARPSVISTSISRPSRAISVRSTRRPSMSISPVSAKWRSRSRERAR